MNPKMKLVTVAEMLAIEKEADAAGLTYAQMMENAGQGLADVIRDLEIGADRRAILGLVGPGNNGGDTLVALSVLATEGWHVRAYLVKREADDFVRRLQKAGGQVMTAAADDSLATLGTWVAAADVLLDGLLGTGARPPVRREVASVLVETIRILHDLEEAPYIVAVDCPSGMDCDLGEVPPESIPADLTVTMAAVKTGMLKLPAYDLVGDLRVVEIGLPAELGGLQAIHTQVVEEGLVARILPPRPSDAHKGTFGRAIIVAGSVNYSGAALLAGSAAYRCGAGLVTLAVPAPLHGALAGRLPEATWLLLPHELGVISRDASEVLIGNLASCSALLVGPGLGMETTTGDFISRLLHEGARGTRGWIRMGFIGADGGNRALPAGQLPPLVFDADGLKLLAQVNRWHESIPGTAVLTPHPGEMSVLTGLTTMEIQQDRPAVAARFAKEWGHVVVLKGAFTVVAAPEGEIAVIPVASAALARAGTGDVLAGIIVGLRAQGVGPFEAAMAGAWIHARAGLYAARRLGNTASVLAGDVLDSVAEVITDLAVVD